MDINRFLAAACFSIALVHATPSIVAYDVVCVHTVLSWIRQFCLGPEGCAVNTVMVIELGFGPIIGDWGIHNILYSVCMCVCVLHSIIIDV